MRPSIPDESIYRAMLGGFVAFLGGIAAAFWRIGGEWTAFVRAEFGPGYGPELLPRAGNAVAAFLLSHVVPSDRTAEGFLEFPVDPDQVLVVAVPVALVAAGFWVALGSARPSRASQGSKVAVPYVFLVCIATFGSLDALPIEGRATAFYLLVIGGLAYPVVFGGIGGFLAAEYEFRTGRSTGEHDRVDRSTEHDHWTGRETKTFDRSDSATGDGDGDPRRDHWWRQ